MIANLNIQEKNERVSAIMPRAGKIIEKQQTQLIEAVTPLKISDLSDEIKGDYIYITGKLKNVSLDEHSSVKVEILFLNSDGNVIDTDWTYAVDSEGILPNEQKYFEIMSKYRNGTSSYRVEILNYY